MHGKVSLFKQSYIRNNPAADKEIVADRVLNYGRAVSRRESSNESTSFSIINAFKEQIVLVVAQE